MSLESLQMLCENKKLHLTKSNQIKSKFERKKKTILGMFVIVGLRECMN